MGGVDHPSGAVVWRSRRGAPAGALWAGPEPRLRAAATQPEGCRSWARTSRL